MRSLIRRSAEFCFTCAVLPAILMFHVRRRLSGADTAITAWSQVFSLIPGTSGVYARRAFLNLTTAGCGPGAFVGFGTLFSHAEVSIGSGTYIGNYCSIGNADIEEDVLVASHVSIMNGCRQHGLGRLDIPVRDQPGEYPRVTIGRDAWIGERAIIAADVGRHAVVGAGSVVIRPVPDYSIVAGVPARPIGDRRDVAEKQQLNAIDSTTSDGNEHRSSAETQQYVAAR